VRKIAILADSKVTLAAHLQQLREAAQNRGVGTFVRDVARRDEIIPAIRDVKSSGAGAINFLASPMFSVNATDFIAQCRNLRLASIYQWPENAEGGALLAYGPRFVEMCTASARGWSSKCYAVSSRPIFR
jgi:hypothetical protein